MSTAPVLGIDIGGTKIQSIVVDAEGRALGDDYRETLADDGRERVLDRMVASAQAALASARVDLAVVLSVGVSAPGPCDFERGVLYEAPNLPGWREVPLAAIMHERLGRPAFLENDANAAALGEARYGAGRGARHMLYLTISTGIGGGLILNGQLYRGAIGSAGELGHMTIDAHGPRHNCGMYGCLEILASGTAIARMAMEAAASGASPALARKAEAGDVTARDVDEAADAGDPAAQEILVKVSRYLGIGFANYINIFNPEVIVIGGGVSRIGSQLLQPAIALSRELAFGLPASMVQSRSAALEGRAEALGVAALARESA